MKKLTLFILFLFAGDALSAKAAQAQDWIKIGPDGNELVLELQKRIKALTVKLAYNFVIHTAEKSDKRLSALLIAQRKLSY